MHEHGDVQRLTGERMVTSSLVSTTRNTSDCPSGRVAANVIPAPISSSGGNAARGTRNTPLGSRWP
jgi:hypothetical protein